MGDKPAYYWVDKWGNGYWSPKKRMRELGFVNVACGPDGPEAKAVAALWNKKWQIARKTGKSYPRLWLNEGIYAGAKEQDVDAKVQGRSDTLDKSSAEYPLSH